MAVPFISLCMIVKDEQATLRRCLDSVRGLVDEIVVADTGSSDGTQTIAREAGAAVIEIPWAQDFSKARNASLAAAHGTWILVLDADEFLGEKDRAAIAKLTREHTRPPGPPKIAFSLLQKSSADGGATGMLVSIARLFPNRPEVRYEWPIHEQVATSLLRHGIPTIATSIEIIHTGYAHPESNRRKQRRNLAILQAQVASGKDVQPLTYFLLAGTQLDLGNVDDALSAYETCRKRALPGDEMDRGAQVRIATCLVRLNRHADAIETMPARPDAAWHPELLVLRAECETALGRSNAARPFLEAVFGVVDRAFVPPCALAAVKIRAALALAAWWKQRGAAALAVAMLREADALRRGGGDFSSVVLARLYRDHRVS